MFKNNKICGFGKNMMNFFRKPRTNQERRSNGKRCNFLDFDEYQVKCRSKRSQSQLPTNWSDISRKDINDKNWKSHRKNQYKK